MVGAGVPGGEVVHHPITAPAVILVGSLMMAQVARVRWTDIAEAIPAFAVLVMIPFTFNIAHGVAAGIVAHVLVRAGSGRRREVSWLMWALAGAIVLSYVFLPRLRH
jgi:AGZA family xanthine/uracil permease-like MFS transporter